MMRLLTKLKDNSILKNTHTRTRAHYLKIYRGSSVLRIYVMQHELSV
jgi:hypothetical protein